jgi:DNA repair exonuclease SbcCD ATPase subunit
LELEKFSEERIKSVQLKHYLENELLILSKYKDKFKDREFVEREMEKIKQELKNVFEKEQALVERRVKAANDFIEAINYVLRKVCEELKPEAFYQIELEKDGYRLVGKDRSGKLIDFEMMSGSERMLASLIFKMALSILLLPTFKILLLDEPFRNLTIKAKEEFLNVLQKTKEFFDQIIILTSEKVEIGNFIELE